LLRGFGMQWSAGPGHGPWLAPKDHASIGATRTCVGMFGTWLNKQKMIAHLRGRLLSKEPNRAIIETGGVRYHSTIPVPTYSELPVAGAQVALHVHTHVREDALALFGFLQVAEKQLFEKLIG